MVSLLARRQGAENTARFTIRTANAGSLGTSSSPGDLAMDPVGNVRMNLDVFRNGGQRVFAIGSGVAPSSSVADGLQMWGEDVEGLAGSTSVHLRNEQGVVTKLGWGLMTRLTIAAPPSATGTTPYVATNAESNTVCVPTNRSERNQVTLPSAEAGLVYSVCV